MTESKSEDKPWTKQPRKVTYVQTSQPRIDMNEQNALFVFLKKQKQKPEALYHQLFMATVPPSMLPSVKIYEAELQYHHHSRPTEILRLPMEVMIDPAKINWCIMNNEKTRSQPMPDMSRELLVLLANNVRSETVELKAKIPGVGEATVYNTTLNKPDGSQEVSTAVSIKGADPTEDVD